MTTGEAVSPRRPFQKVTAWGLFAGFWTVSLALLFGFPLFWAVSSALKLPIELNVIPPLWLPPTPRWKNFIEVNEVLPFFRFMGNTAVVTLATTIGGVITASIVAYGFSHFRFRGRHTIFILMLSTMMLPMEVTLIPTYLIFNEIRLVDTFWPLFLPAWFGGGPFAIFLFRQFFLSIPRDLSDAAKIDGCHVLRFYRSILVPLSVPVMITLSILFFQQSWNELMRPLIYLTSMTNYTVSVGLMFLRTQILANVAQRGEPTEHLLMAGSVISMMPSLILFFILQRYFIRGVIMSGIKG